jgi:hypothetical protein
MVRQSYWEHLDKGILETRPISHPSPPYLSSRTKVSTIENIDRLVSAKLPLPDNTPLLENSHKMFVTWIVWPRIPQRTLHGQRCMQETLSMSFFRGDNTRRRWLPYRWRNDG